MWLNFGKKLKNFVITRGDKGSVAINKDDVQSLQSKGLFLKDLQSW